MWPVPINHENIDACDPALDGVEWEFILHGLEFTSEKYVHSLFFLFVLVLTYVHLSMWHLV